MSSFSAFVHLATKYTNECFKLCRVPDTNANIGRAIEWNNGGFRKRLSDYTRDSSSAHKYGSGQKMYEHRNELAIDLLIVGTDAEEAQVCI